tara:strand:+ start:1390 stop:2397 length:1008 start_codon:yes stop_codon:yes gene_type:complete
MVKRILKLDEVENLAIKALVDSGTLPESAKSMGKAIRAAERDGIRSHGLIYIPTYCEHVICGKVNGNAVPELKKSRLSSIQIDAKSGFAHPAIDLGFKEILSIVKYSGCGVITVKNSYNCGVLGFHVERIAELGLLGIGFTNSPASIAPYGGKKPVIGTNPIAIAVPDKTGGISFVIDQSASVIAKSEILMHARKKTNIPEGWALDEDGKPTTDPEIALKGSMVPSGGYKGFLSGLFVEVMAAALSGAMLGIEASPFSGKLGGPPKTGQCFFAIDPYAFSGKEFFEKIDDLVEAISVQHSARLPGERRKNYRKMTELKGVEVDEKIIENIMSFCK